MNGLAVYNRSLSQGDVLDQLPAKRRKKVTIEAKIAKSLNIAARTTDNASKKDYQVHVHPIAIITISGWHLRALI